MGTVGVSTGVRAFILCISWTTKLMQTSRLDIGANIYMYSCQGNEKEEGYVVYQAQLMTLFIIPLGKPQYSLFLLPFPIASVIGVILTPLITGKSG